VQQTLAFLFPALSLAGMMASSAVVSVAIAIVSWKLIEERALARKGDFAEATSRAFNFGLAKIGSLAGSRGLRLPTPCRLNPRPGPK
jgi:peptidoglycan/LPS O-acetylase OafA/YrhL